MDARRVLTVAGLFLAAAVLWSAASWVAAQQEKKADPAPPAARWEHKVVRAEAKGREIDPGKTEEALNKLGADGWECAGTVGDVTGSQPQGTWTHALLILKRPKP